MTDGIFIDPDNVLPRLHDQLQRDKCVAVTGMAGIGKSTLAQEYGDRYSGYYKDTITIDAQFPDQILANFCKKVMEAWSDYPIYQRLVTAYASTNESEIKAAQESLRDQTLDWIANGKYPKSGSPYLFVFQAVDSPGDYLQIYTSRRGKYLSILITSRVQNFDTSIASRFPAPLMPDGSAIELLWRYGGLTKEQYNSLNETERDSIRQLACGVAGGLPLAIRAIGHAFQTKKFASFSQFAIMHRDDVEDKKRTFGYNEAAFGMTVLPTEVNKRDHPGVYETFRVCINLACDSKMRGDQTAASVRELLTLMALMAPEEMPETIIESAASAGLLGDNLKAASAKPRGVEQVIDVADDCGLIEWSAGSAITGSSSIVAITTAPTSISRSAPTIKMLRMHSVVREVIRMDMDAAAFAESGARATQFVESALAEARASKCIKDTTALTPHARTLYEQRIDVARCPNIQQIVADAQVQEALAGGDWSSVFVNKQGEAPSYAALRNMEAPDWRDKMTRVVSSISSAAANEMQARQCFACIYFLAHYWWDSYFDSSMPGVNRLVDSLPSIWTVTHKSADDVAFAAALQEFQSHYPGVASYATRAARKNDWNSVYSSLTRIAALVGVDLDATTADVRDVLTPTEAYVNGILLLYLAEATRYAEAARGYRSGDNVRIWTLCSRSQEMFARNKDAFHYSWAIYEEADARLEAASYLQQHPGFLGNKDPYKAQYVKTLECATKALEIAIGVVKPFPKAASGAVSHSGANGTSQVGGDPSTNDPEGGAAELDAELIANCYRVLADHFWLDPGSRPVSWGCSCAAALAAFSFVESQQDEYARHFYEEQKSRILNRLIDASESDWFSQVYVGRYIQSRWNDYWKTTLREPGDFFPPLTSRDRLALDAALFPENPNVADAANPTSVSRKAMSALFERAPDSVKDIPPMLYPCRYSEALDAIRNSSRAVNEPHLTWVLDEVSQLHLRPVRRDDIPDLAASADKSFHFSDPKMGKIGTNIVGDMLETHCNAPSTIELNARQGTMMPTRYYVLTRGSAIIGLTGLYRPVWSSETVFSLAWFFIDPVARQQGMGRLLLNATLQIARKHGSTRMMIETAPNLQHAIGLYEKVGFVKAGEVPDYYSPGASMILYTRDLADIEVADTIPDLI